MTRPPRIPGSRFLHSPGPTRVPDEVIHAMQRQPMDLVDPRVPALIKACEAGMKTLLQTERADVFFCAANGHGGWEAVIANLVAPGTAILVPGSGHFSDGCAEQVEAFGGRALRTRRADGHAFDTVAIDAALRDDTQHTIAAVFAVHTDTAAVRRALDACGHPALLVVDVVASLAAAPYSMDALGANVVMGASQKGLMLQPGLALVAADARAMQAAADNPSPLAHLAGLQAALGLIADEGLAQVHTRHARLARMVHAPVETWSAAGGVRLFARVPAARSVSVTAIEVAPGDPEAGVPTRLLRGDAESQLSDNEPLHNCIFLLNAGHETTTNLVGNGLHALPTHGARLQRLVDAPMLLATCEPPAGVFLTLAIGAANRDPAVFTAPGRPDIARKPNRHLAFGQAAHGWSGMKVARREAHVAIGRLLARYPRLAAAGAPVRDRRVRFRGLRDLPGSV